MFPAIYVINLDRDSGRLGEFMEANAGAGLSIRRIPAVLGADIKDPPVDIEGYRRLNAGGGPPKASEVGCYLSHLRALEEFLGSGEPCAVIMEDDAAMVAEALGDLAELAGRDDWDVVKLFCFHGGAPVTMARLASGRRLVAHLTRTTSCAAYLVNRRGAERMIDALLPMREPIDHAMDQGWATGLRIRGVRPHMAKLLPSASTSTIGYGRRPRQPLPGLVTAQLRKGLREIRRFIHGLGEYLSSFRPHP